MGGSIIIDRRRVPLSAAWQAAVSVTATAYTLAPDALLAPSRGRGPRPPKPVWEARQVAIFLSLLLTDQSHAKIARHIGFHRDTVHSHCQAMRERVADDLDFEERVDALRVAAAGVAAQITAAAGRMKKAASSDRSSDPDKNHANVILAFPRRTAAA